MNTVMRTLGGALGRANRGDLHRRQHRPRTAHGDRASPSPSCSRRRFSWSASSPPWRCPAGARRAGRRRRTLSLSGLRSAAATPTARPRPPTRTPERLKQGAAARRSRGGPAQCATRAPVRSACEALRSLPSSTTFSAPECGRVGEDVVGGHRVVEREAVGGEQRRVQTAADDQPQQLRDAERVDQSGRDRDVADPQLLEMQRRRIGRARRCWRRVRQAGSARSRARTVCGTPTASNATSAPSPSVSSMTAATASSRPLLIVMSAPNRSALSSRLSARSIATIRPGRVEPRGEDRRQPDRPGADDRDGVAGRDHAVEHADLEGGRKDVGEEQHLLVAQLVGDLVDRVVGERHACVLGLQAVDQVAEDPAAATEALAVASLLAVAAATA